MLKPKEKILLYGSNLWNFAEGMLGPLFAVFAARIGGNILDISWAWATYLIVTGVAVIVIGRISDGDGRSKEKIMVAGYALTTLFTFGYLFVSEPSHLFIIQAGLGLALALSNPTWYALYDKYADGRHRGYTWGLADGESKIVVGVALIIGGLIVNYFSFTALFLTMGTIHALATLYQSRILFAKA
ncbi:MAG: MFS transporter [Parcubacteria group bacterium]|nr:MFS transporter [Parcubacteria group bacterium]